MSYSNDECTDKFSEEQSDAMVANLLGPRNDLLDYPEPVYSDVTTMPVLVEPADDAVDIFANYAVFKWTPAVGASEYHLQVSYSPSFTAIAADVITWDTVAIVNTLETDKTYYWRVKPLAPLNTCEAYTLGNSFQTSLLLAAAIEENNLLGNYFISPNPVQSGSQLTINYQSDYSFEGSVQLYDLTGKELMSEVLNVIGGVNSINLTMPQLSEGMYVMTISDGSRTETSKIVVTK